LWVINVLNIQNEINVFLRTGSTKDDGYLNDPSLGGGKYTSTRATYEQLYHAVEIDYAESYRGNTGNDLFGSPRQIRLGIRLDY